MINIIWYIIVGFLAGLIARGILPGADHMGFLATTAVGIVGGLLGGFIGGQLNKVEPGTKFHKVGFIWSIIGAVVLLVILRLLR